MEKRGRRWPILKNLWSSPLENYVENVIYDKKANGNLTSGAEQKMK